MAAIDTNVLLDILSGIQPASSVARQALAMASVTGSLVICPVVYAETAGNFGREEDLLAFLDALGIRVEAFSSSALWEAGRAWRAYARRRGQ
jgi:predicted nucleic acid-binding protein